MVFITYHLLLYMTMANDEFKIFADDQRIYSARTMAYAHAGSLFPFICIHFKVYLLGLYSIEINLYITLQWPIKIQTSSIQMSLHPRLSQIGNGTVKTHIFDLNFINR